MDVFFFHWGHESINYLELQHWKNRDKVQEKDVALLFFFLFCFSCLGLHFMFGSKYKLPNIICLALNAMHYELVDQ